MGCGKTDDYYWYWLCNIPGIGITKIHRLLDEYGDAKSVYSEDWENVIKICRANRVLTKNNVKSYDPVHNAYPESENYIASTLSLNELTRINECKKSTQLYEEFSALEKLNLKFVHMESPDYPDRLKEIYDAPVGLYVRGVLPRNDSISVAIVGARSCSEYGRTIAYELGRSFAYMGINVISGMALGIDAAGQNGCVDGGGLSVAVLGCGADICYPRENIELYRKLAQKGGIVSEYAPGTQPSKGSFPVRNRIISGLSDVIIVVEAKQRSGSLITVDLALEQNKEIMAVPGRITDPLSKGCNELIKMGAMVITCADDIRQVDAVCRWFEERAGNSGKAGNSKNAAVSDTCTASKSNSHADSGSGTDMYAHSCKSKLTGSSLKVYNVLSLTPKDIDEIIADTGLDVTAVTRGLMELQLSGAVKETSKNCYVRCSL